MSNKNYGKVKKGFGGLNKHLEGKGKYVASCNSCNYFYQLKGEPEEICHNTNVTKFDMAYDEEKNRVYCTYWIPCGLKRRED